MCGIAGVALTSESIRPPLESMYVTLSHRGPDDQGLYWSEGNRVGLTQCRLAVIDLSPAAHQPMSDASKRVWITFNGEIYNFRDLRRELDSRGHRFRSASDTEVVIEAYIEWGEDRDALGIPSDVTVILFAVRFGYEKKVLLLLEALAVVFRARPAARCALVMSEIPAHRELLDESSAIFVSPCVGDLAAALQRVIDSPREAPLRAARAYDAVSAFSVSAMTANVDELYAEVLYRDQRGRR